ncbi:EamA family transporter RarD [Herbaspirillum sp. alder98]|uniref:EamA family transporter RarD n=1 Tax=Herbaspirillum sp. alder98 TaxID=2913096 RepID=UPI001CD8E76D|nr:EamA family transporter RarD [Herbaspirillum sp. alder98]MCA1324791.1 EamA family transporter RarD [Herbaspirillum sp. alder98]
MNHPDIARGIGLSVLASALFAFLSGYTRLLAPLDGTTIFAWRILWTLVAVLLLLMWRGRARELPSAFITMLDTPQKLLCLLVMAVLLGLQQWLFLWASVNARALEVSLGYFLLPLSMVLVGRFYYHERLAPLEKLAVTCALLGVAHELWMTRAFSWTTLVVALGYPPYFILRRRIRIDSLMLFAVELLLLSPVALLMLWQADAFAQAASQPMLATVLLPLLGLASMVALASFLAAGQLLPMGLFGILGYVEPVLLVLVAMAVLGETLSPGQLGTYVPIWVAVGLTMLHSRRLMRRAAG